MTASTRYYILIESADCAKLFSYLGILAKPHPFDYSIYSSHVVNLTEEDLLYLKLTFRYFDYTRVDDLLQNTPISMHSNNMNNEH